MHSKKIFGILGAIVVIATISAVVGFENIDAKEPALDRIYVTVEMNNINEMKPGQTMVIPFNLINTNVEGASSANVYVTEQDYEHLKNNPLLAPTNNGIDMRLSKSSSIIPASTGDTLQRDPMSVTVSVPEDTAPGLYEYTLIVEVANNSLQYREYFYINVV